MKKCVFLIVAVSILFMSLAYAEVNIRRQLAEELLVLTEVKNNIEKYFDMVKQMQMAQLKNMDIPSGESGKVASLQEKLMNIARKEMSWENLKEDYISIYAEIFTEEELQGIIAFYKTPIGKKFIEKQPELLQRSMEISQKQMKILMPKMQKLTQETIDAYKESKKEFNEQIN